SRYDFDPGTIRYQIPQLLHVGVVQGDAAVGPVQAAEEPFGVFLIDRCAVDHDHPARIHPPLPGLGAVLEVRIVKMQAQVVTRAAVSPVDMVDACRGAVVAALLLVPHRLAAQRYAVAADDLEIGSTSELQSRENIVCRLLLEKKNW